MFILLSVARIHNLLTLDANTNEINTLAWFNDEVPEFEVRPERPPPPVKPPTPAEGEEGEEGAEEKKDDEEEAAPEESPDKTGEEQD